MAEDLPPRRGRRRPEPEIPAHLMRGVGHRGLSRQLGEQSSTVSVLGGLLAVKHPRGRFEPRGRRAVAVRAWTVPAVEPGGVPEQRWNIVPRAGRCPPEPSGGVAEEDPQARQHRPGLDGTAPCRACGGRRAGRGRGRGHVRDRRGRPPGRGLRSRHGGGRVRRARAAQPPHLPGPRGRRQPAAGERRAAAPQHRPRQRRDHPRVAGDAGARVDPRGRPAAGRPGRRPAGHRHARRTPRRRSAEYGRAARRREHLGSSRDPRGRRPAAHHRPHRPARGRGGHRPHREEDKKA